MIGAYHFSKREIEVVELLLQGKSNKQIALALGISEHTVEFHLKNIYAKLGVRSRTEAILVLGKTPGWKGEAFLGDSVVEAEKEISDNHLKGASPRTGTLPEEREMIQKNSVTFSGWSILLIPIMVLLVGVSVYLVTRLTANATPTLTPASTSSSAGVYFSVYDTLYRMDLDGSNLKTISGGVLDSGHFAVDTAQNMLYLSRWGSGRQILAVDLLTQQVSLVRDGPDDGGQGISVDPSSQKMYLGLYYSGVYVLDLKNSAGWQALVTPDQLSPLLGQRGQLRIDASRRQLYFRTAFNGECGECRYIWRVNLDGSNLVKIIRANGGDALALDLAGRKMYFSDLPGDNTVKRANLDGSQPETLFSVPTPFGFIKSLDLDVAHNKIYLSLFNVGSGYTRRAIARANLDGTGYEILYTTEGNGEVAVSGGLALFLP